MARGVVDIKSVTPEALLGPGFMGLTPHSMQAALTKALARIPKNGTSPGLFFDQTRVAGYMRSLFAAGLEKPLGTPQWMLLEHSYQISPIDRIIIGARQFQVEHIARLDTPGSSRIGLTVQHVNEDDPTIDTKDETTMKRKLDAIERLKGVNKDFHPGGFKGWMTAATMDNLKWDRITMIKQRNFRGQPVMYHSIDPTTVRPIVDVLIRYALEQAAKSGDPNKASVRAATMLDAQQHRMEMLEQLSYIHGLDLTRSSYVQVINDEPVAAWTENEISVQITRQPNQINRTFYGVSSFENSLELADMFVTAWQFNKGQFNQMYPESMLILQGDYDEEGLEEFKQHLRTAGRYQDKRLAIISADEAQNTNAQVAKLREAPKDMVFNELMQLTINLKCAAYRMDPTIINFKDMGGGNVNFQQARTEEMRISSAKEEGLHGLVMMFCDWLTEQIVAPFDPELVVVPLNLDKEDEGVRLDNISKRKWYTVDEMRAADGTVGPHPDAEVGKKLLSQEGIQVEGALFAQKQQEQQMAMGGGEEGAPEEGAPMDDGGGDLPPELAAMFGGGDTAKSMSAPVRKAEPFRLDITLELED